VLNETKGAKFHKARAVAYALQSKVESTLLKMEKDGVIERVTSALSAKPIAVVGKKESEDVRVCGDFSVTYNTYANVETYPMPQIEDMHSAFRGCTVFSVLGIKRAYYQQRCVCCNCQVPIGLSKHRTFYSLSAAYGTEATYSPRFADSFS